ncbi:MAG TPA: diguanylate cyclase [Gaiellaceae bacterium]|nr:diguanylate cyclase [Gaiellaceae bacterium]
MRTAAFPLRLRLGLPAWARSRSVIPPVRQGMYARPGLFRRTAPFLGVTILAIAVLPLPPGGDRPAAIALASGLTALIVLTVALAPWDRLPQFAEVVPPLAYFIVIALLRESQGGATSGYSAVAMLPVFWLALHGTRNQLGIGIAGLAAVFFVPLLLLGAPEYPATEWRRAILWISVAPIVGFTVQALVAELRTRAEETRLGLANIEEITASMRRIGASTDPDAVRRAICSSARSIAGADVVQLLEPSGERRLTLTSADGMRIPRAGEEAGAGLAHLSCKPVFLRQATHGTRHGLRSMHFEPVLRDETAMAVLVLGWSRPVKTLSPRIESGMRMLAAEAAIALDRARLLAQLQETARTDDLTGLPNRRAWEEELPRELARAARDSRPVCVAMLDLDRFKRFNDHRGHQAGDRLLRQAASAWASHLRVSDMLARYGGEEFSVLLPGCTLEDAHLLVQRLRAAMPDGETVSAGIACWDETETAEELVGRADAALYTAKRGGRDRLISSA